MDKERRALLKPKIERERFSTPGDIRKRRRDEESERRIQRALKINDEEIRKRKKSRRKKPVREDFKKRTNFYLNK